MEELAKPENLDKAQTYIDFVKNNLEPLAEHLKVSVEWLWGILVKQARVEAIVYLLISIGLFITSVSLAIVFFKAIKKARFGSGYGTPKTVYIHKKTGEEVEWDVWYDDKKDYDVVNASNKTNTQGYVAIVSGVMWIIMSIASTVTTATNLKIIVTGLVNPEFRAIEKIVEYAKPAVKPSEAK